MMLGGYFSFNYARYDYKSEAMNGRNYAILIMWEVPGMFSLPKRNKLYYHYKYYVNNRSRDLAKEEEEGRFKNTVLSSIDIIWLYVYLLSRD